MDFGFTQLSSATILSYSIVSQEALVNFKTVKKTQYIASFARIWSLSLRTDLCSRIWGIGIVYPVGFSE